MKLDELVSFRIGRDHSVAYGVLVDVSLLHGTGTVMRDGKKYVRSLKRIKSAKAGKKAAAMKVGIDLRRNRRWPKR